MNKGKLAHYVLISFNTQFAENQNHHQALFIQFISVVLVVIGGFAFIYINTLSSADLFEYKKVDSETTSYSIVHLFGSYCVAQIILMLLCEIILNIGYAFRKDQKVNYWIRMKALGKTYERYFGDKAFKAHGLTWKNYLPSFNLIFYCGIVLVQIALFVLMMIATFHLGSYDSSLGLWASLFRWMLPVPVLLSICS